MMDYFGSTLKIFSINILAGIAFSALVLVGVLLLVFIICINIRHNKEIKTANLQYESLLANINAGMIVVTDGETAEGSIATYVSSGFTEMTGYTLKDLIMLYQGRYLDIIIDEDRQAAFKEHTRQIKNGNTYRVPYRVRKKDGEIIWVIDNGYLIHDGSELLNYSILTDISLIKNQEEQLRLSEKRFSVAINASSGTLFEVDLKKQLYTHFENAERIFGTSAEKLLADTRKFSSLPFNEFTQAVTEYFFHPDDRAVALNAMANLRKESTASYEARLRRADDTYIWARIDLSMSLDALGEPQNMIGFMSDINDVKKQAEQLKTQVQFDSMTGIYNKVAMSTLSNKILSDSSNGLHALIVLDVDNFKGINDTLGHAFGDILLIEICTKLKTLLRKSDIIGRMGGDEFAIFMQNVPDTSGVLKKATELSAALRQTYVGEKKDYKISCSLGIIMVDSGKENFEALYRKADAALYQAKQNGKDMFVLYKEENAAKYHIANTRTDDEEMQNLQVSHNIETYIFELLYASKDFNLSINMAIAAIGQKYHVSRVAIFENDDANLTTNNIYEWCNDGISAEKDNLQNLPTRSGEQSIFDCFDANGLLYCNDVRELPPYLKQILQAKGALSNLQVTIVNDGKVYGFIGFDECKEYRIWTSEEIEKLSYLSKLLSVFLFKKKIESLVLENLKTRIQILDVLPDYICVVNPKTHSIEYTNKKMKELIPTAQSGAFCFSTLRGGQHSPCTTCLVERIKRGDTNNLEIVSEDGSVRLGVNAISINWSDDQKMVLLYGIRK